MPWVTFFDEARRKVRAWRGQPRTAIMNEEDTVKRITHTGRHRPATSRWLAAALLLAAAPLSRA